MGFLRKIKTAPLEDKMNEELRQRRESDPFGFAEYDAANAERAGYSDYSYCPYDSAKHVKNTLGAELIPVKTLAQAITLLGIRR